MKKWLVRNVDKYILQKNSFSHQSRLCARGVHSFTSFCMEINPVYAAQVCINNDRAVPNTGV